MRILTLVLLFVSIMSNAQEITSQSQRPELNFAIENNFPTYWVNFKGKEIIKKSKLNIVLTDGRSLGEGFKIVKSETTTVDETWKPVLGEVAEIRNNYEQRQFYLENGLGLKMNIVFRIFDEGVAFRYEFPEQAGLNYFVVADEKTQFNLAGNHKTFWIPGDFDSQEYAYNETKLSEIDNSKLDLNNGIALKSIKGNNYVQSPLMMKTDDKIYINIFEAAVDNYPVMHLKVNTATFELESQLVPNATGAMAYLKTPSHTPWRTIMVTDDAREIVASKMILNLNEPCKIENTSWIKPMKYVGIWWEMHVGISTWDYAGSQNGHSITGELIPSGKHGATTQNAKRYIDFAAKNGFDGVLIEGWNTGWEDWFGNWKEDVFDFRTAYPDFDLKEVSSYAKSKGVKLIMHHETSGSASNYERQLDRSFNLMQQYGYPAVKTGYVGKIIPRGEFHDGQTMVNHYHHVVKRAAEYQFMVNSHESSRPTGMHRTYPNYIAAEAARGNEFNGWSNGNPPAHETILPFTRLLGGPMDYTPGIFEIKMSYYDSSKTFQVHTTLAKQLALYVTMYSPLQMAADLPENYERYPDAFQFIKDVAIDWQNSIYLEAEPGDFVTVARKQKNSESWFLGAITDENPRATELSLSFLTPGKSYIATIYEDGKDAHWEKNPKAYKIRKIKVTSKSKLDLNLAAGGGAAILIIPES